MLRNEKAVAASPADWMPWTYRATLARMAEQQSPAPAVQPRIQATAAA